MKRLIFSIFCVSILAIGAAAQTANQPATTPGNVSRVIYMDVLPGKQNDLSNFIRTNSKPILDEQVKQGLIVSYGYFTKPTSSGPGDWDLGLVITYKTYAEAIDANPERAAKFDAITLKHYGTAEARTKANESIDAMRTVVSSYLVRGLTFNPMPK